MPETTTLANECITEALSNRTAMKLVEIQSAKGESSQYYISEKNCTYENTNLKCAICYSKSLEDIKKKTIERQIKKEEEKIQKLSKTYAKRDFACEEDANKEGLTLMEKDLKKIKFHTVSTNIHFIEKKKKGRQPKDISKIKYTKQYFLNIDIKIDEEKVKKQFEEACTFVLCSNDLNLTAEDLLKEYKTQSGVEKKFQQLKSPHFVNSLYLDNPARIEALTYLILISMMILSVAEYVVRRELKKQDEMIIGPGGIKMKKPTLSAIIKIFNVGIAVKVISLNGKKYRSLAKPLSDSHKKILQSLSISEDIFYWNK